MAHRQRCCELDHRDDFTLYKHLDPPTAPLPFRRWISSCRSTSKPPPIPELVPEPKELIFTPTLMMDFDDSFDHIPGEFVPGSSFPLFGDTEDFYWPAFKDKQFGPDPISGVVLGQFSAQHW